VQDLIDSSTISKEDVVAGIHCMHPKYLEQQFEASRQNLGLETIDLMYIHNAYEAQAATLKSTQLFMDKLKVKPLTFILKVKF
jgi:aryl-alcohol dehydrogenase-like predicted oxidoreductase